MGEPTYPSLEHQDQFYAALGRAITDWANLEAELFEITASILGCARERAAVVFYRTPTIDSRLTLTSDLIKSLLPRHLPGKHPPPLAKEWKVLQSDIKDNLPIRNRLAHDPAAPVVNVYKSIDGKVLKKRIRQASYMSETQRLRNPDQPLNALGIEDIRAHITVVSSLINCLRNFRDVAFAKPPKASGEYD